jgi:hypothetical protein
VEDVEAHAKGAADGAHHAGADGGAAVHAAAQAHAHAHSQSHHKLWFLSGLWQPPRLMRDWQNIRDEDNRRITWAELFFDLIYVTAIAKLGEALRSGITGEELDDESISFRDYVVVFTVVFQLWASTVIYATRFNTDDLFHKIWLSLVMVGMVLVGMHVKGGLAGSNTTWLAGSMASLRVLLVLAYLRVAYHVPRARWISLTVVGVDLGRLLPRRAAAAAAARSNRPSNSAGAALVRVAGRARLGARVPHRRRDLDGCAAHPLPGARRARGPAAAHSH